MKAITIRQPWAHAILHLGKDIENRDWHTNFRGRVAIHASKKVDVYEVLGMRKLIKDRNINVQLPDPNILVGGSILGTVEIVDCVKASSSPWFIGDYGFVLRNPIVLATPIPCRGALGFWDVPAEIEAQILTPQEQPK